jgi:hypothetical protein
MAAALTGFKETQRIHVAQAGRALQWFDFEWNYRTGETHPGMNCGHDPSETFAAYICRWTQQRDICSFAHGNSKPVGILLLGENDLTFGAALCDKLYDLRTRTRSCVLLPSVRETEEESRLDALTASVDHSDWHAVVSASTQRLSARGVSVMYDMDATALHQNTRVQTLMLSFAMGYIMWNFPFTGDEDNSDLQKDLLRKFFFSISQELKAAAQQGHNGCADTKVLVSLCHNQLSKWTIERLAQEQFLRLTNSWIFDPADFPGYRPKRNQSANEFPISQTVTYEFSYV